MNLAVRSNAVVSVWLGRFESQENLELYLKQGYNEDEEVNSVFMTDFTINYYDDSFQEAFRLSNEITPSKQHLIGPLSYANTFVDKIEFVDWSNYNSVISLYNFEYAGAAKSGGVIFIGSYPYQIR